jgi:hypothetical protein
MMREAIVLDGIEPVNVIVLADGPDGDALLSDTCVEITGLDSKPGLGIGWTYVDGAFVPPPVPPLTWEEVRAGRDTLLTASDWTQMPDSPLNGEQKNTWADYRQELRDLPQSFATPDEVVWPEAP